MPLTAASVRTRVVSWNDAAEITSYLRDPDRMPASFSKRGFANPAFVLGLTNWALAGNVRMSPWLHLQTDSQNYRPIAANTELVVESTIADLFEKKGHEFIDVDMNIFDRADEAPFVQIRDRHRGLGELVEGGEEAAAVEQRGVAQGGGAVGGARWQDDFGLQV